MSCAVRPAALLALALACLVFAGGCGSSNRSARGVAESQARRPPTSIEGWLAVEGAGYDAGRWDSTIYARGDRPWNYRVIRVEGANDLVLVTRAGVRKSWPPAGAGEESVAVGPARIDGHAQVDDHSFVADRITLLDSVGFAAPDTTATPSVPQSVGADRWVVENLGVLPSGAPTADRPAWLKLLGPGGSEVWQPQTQQYALIDLNTKLVGVSSAFEAFRLLGAADGPPMVRVTLEDRHGVVYASSVQFVR